LLDGKPTGTPYHVDCGRVRSGVGVSEVEAADAGSGPISRRRTVPAVRPERAVFGPDEVRHRVALNSGTTWTLNVNVTVDDKSDDFAARSRKADHDSAARRTG
jgi:hypothetical protein